MTTFEQLPRAVLDFVTGGATEQEGSSTLGPPADKIHQVPAPRPIGAPLKLPDGRTVTFGG